MHTHTYSHIYEGNMKSTNIFSNNMNIVITSYGTLVSENNRVNKTSLLYVGKWIMYICVYVYVYVYVYVHVYVHVCVLLYIYMCIYNAYVYI